MEKKKVLYLGTDPRNYAALSEVVHYPVIQIVPRDFESFVMKHQIADIARYTHLILTSKNAVKVLMDVLAFYNIPTSVVQRKQWICIGSSTEKALRDFGVHQIMVSEEETQEGVIKLLDQLELKSEYLFYPRSAKARPTLSYYLRMRRLRHQICDLYDTETHLSGPLPTLEHFDEVVFTSPSTVEAFFELFPTIPPALKLIPLGPITTESLKSFINNL